MWVSQAPYHPVNLDEIRWCRFDFRVYKGRIVETDKNGRYSWLMSNRRIQYRPPSIGLTEPILIYGDKSLSGSHF